MAGSKHLSGSSAPSRAEVRPPRARRAGPRGPCPVARVRRLWLGLSATLAVVLLLPGLLAARADDGLAGLGLALLGASLVLGASWLAFERLVTPELRARERERDELDARHSAALHAAGELSQYVRDVSQEVRATMHAVLGQTQLLSRSPLDSSQHRQLRTIDAAARVLLRIMNDLMALSRTGPRRFDVVPLGGSLHDVLRASADLLQPAAKNRGVVLELRLALELPDQVLLDTGRVQQVLLGACRLAIESCAAGTLAIDARPIESSAARFVLSMRVTESGARASAERAPERPPTPPLLLELLQAMGGSLELGEGAGALELCLPIQRIAGSEAPRLPPDATGRPLIRLPVASAPLLVVASDEPSRLAAIELLENLGFEVEAASSAPRALERVAQAKFSLLLLDTELDGLDGYMAAARILTELGQGRPPILGLCRPPLAASRERAAAAGIDALLEKPLEREALCGALAEWLPDDNHPASSGTRLSQAGALAQATERAQAAKRSHAPLGAPPALASRPPASERAAALERFAREAPGQHRALAGAVAEGRRDDAARLAASLAAHCRSAGLSELAALCEATRGDSELSNEQLGAAVAALGGVLDGVLRQLGAPPALESSPASATSERAPDSP